MAEGTISETQVKEGWSLSLVNPDGDVIKEFNLGGNSYEDHDAQFYLGEEIIEALPEDAFEPYEGG